MCEKPGEMREGERREKKEKEKRNTRREKKREGLGSTLQQRSKGSTYHDVVLFFALYRFRLNRFYGSKRDLLCACARGDP